MRRKSRAVEPGSESSIWTLSWTTTSSGGSIGVGGIRLERRDDLVVPKSNDELERRRYTTPSSFERNEGVVHTFVIPNPRGRDTFQPPGCRRRLDAAKGEERAIQLSSHRPVKDRTRKLVRLPFRMIPGCETTVSIPDDGTDGRRRFRMRGDEPSSPQCPPYVPCASQHVSSH